MDCVDPWAIGVMEYWSIGLNASLYYSNAAPNHPKGTYSR
jgi:hypothetical protein